MEVETVMDEKQQETKQIETTMSFTTLVVLTGFIGGVFWCGLGYLAYVFNLNEVRPNVILESWIIGSWKEGLLGNFLSIGLIGLVSILAAFIYYFTLRKYQSPLVGMIYGVILFLFVFTVLNPIFPEMGPLKELSRDTIITIVCLFILYGLFVGYTISYEESEIQYQKDREKKD